MSFITKRERVFNEYELFDLPARNEGKLKAYASCTDARAWSHFCSDKSEHLVEIIKRNNETCKPKYVPTEAIVNTLLANKQSEIARLKRKIEEFEQMLAAYDDLDLTCEQKCEIAKAHAAIKEANKDLNELWFDLDLSGFTGIDSEGFETGKSRGDEPSKFKESHGDETPRSKEDEVNMSSLLTPRSKGDEWSFEKEPPQKETKSNQTGEMPCYCDATTNAVDPRIEEMRETIICKDAKLNAMKNSMAVLENDVCEPYCIYADIYTALEKIFGILCQNDKYKLYLNLMTSGKNTRCLDIKGKILFKLKVLEKFNVALMAPCSQDFASHNDRNSNNFEQQCSCCHADISLRVETAFALTSSESQHPSLDNKRAQLVADIMQHDEMKEILSKENIELNISECDDAVIDNNNIEQENLKRLKNLQDNFNDLLTCYEALKTERDCLMIKCRKYEDLEKEFESLNTQLREYNALWNEKEHYRKRSTELDTLKEQYLVLCDETTNLETELKAESEINIVKTKTIEEFRNENILLEKKLNEATITFEKEKNIARCKLKEAECTIMCQGQQIKSLSLQIDKLLERNTDEVQPRQSEAQTVILIDEINELKEQLKNLQDALFGSEEEKQQLQEEYQNKLNLINRLRIEVEDWKSNYEKSLQNNEYLTDSFQGEINRLTEQNNNLSLEVNNLIDILNNKSQELKKLMEEVEIKNKENYNLNNQLDELHEAYNSSITALDAEKIQAIKSLQIARQESHELLEHIKNYDKKLNEQNTLSSSYQEQSEKYKAENEDLQIKLARHENDRKKLLAEIARLKEIATRNINSLEDEKEQYKLSLELTKKDSKLLEDKINTLEGISHKMQMIKESHEILIKEKNKIETELANKTSELDKMIREIKLQKKESKDLQEKLKSSEKLKTDLENVDDTNQKKIKGLISELNEKKRSCDILLNSLNNLKEINNTMTQKIEILSRELSSLRERNETLLLEKADIQKQYSDTNDTLTELKGRIKYYEGLELQYEKLRNQYDQIKKQKSKLEDELDIQKTELKRIEEDNQALNYENLNIISQNEDLEKALINARTQLASSSSSIDIPHNTIIKEIEDLRREQLSKHKEIKSLLEKLDESDNIISNLSEDILARDNKIAILENHINQLQSEVIHLHHSLDEIIDTGEQIKENSCQKIRESLNLMEAHHSKATHNMKIELAKLRCDNVTLEKHLSLSKIGNEDSARDNQIYKTQVNNLLNEREIIVTDIKQLELNSVGDSTLSPENCNIEAILCSLDRIRQHISSKSTSLEQTLLKVQNSYQIVQSKADEAKKIVENEKQKILSEKEEAIKDRHNMEKQLTNLKIQLDNQISHDKQVIKDLEAEILNQKLIYDMLKETTQNYVSKLKEEIQSLKELYDRSLENISELEKKCNLMSEEKKAQLDEVHDILQQKNMEITILQKNIDEIQNIPKQSQDVQVSILNKNDKNTQTEIIHNLDFDKYYETKETKMTTESVIPFYASKSTAHERNISQTDKRKHGTEVQVLTASVEPEFDYVRNSNLNHKLKHLSVRPLEHDSYSGSRENDIDISNESMTVRDNKKNKNKEINPSTDFFNVVDIYSKPSLHTNSSKYANDKYPDHEEDNKTTDKTMDIELAYNSFNSRQNVSDFFESVSGISNDRDLFEIYNSESNQGNNSNENKSLQMSGCSNEVLETNFFQSTKNIRKQVKNKSHREQENENKHSAQNSYLYLKTEDLVDDDSARHKINIKLPRIKNQDSNASSNILNSEKKSTDSYVIQSNSQINNTHLADHKTGNDMIIQWKSRKNYSDLLSSHDESQHVKSKASNIMKNNGLTSKLTDESNFKNSISSTDLMQLQNENFPSSHNEENLIKHESQHQLSRISADIRLIKNKGTDPPKNENNIESNRQNHFRLNYILASAQIDSDNIRNYKSNSSLRKTRSEDSYIAAKNKDNANTSEKLSSLNMQTKSYTEKGINTTTKLDSLEDCEMKIKDLTNHLAKIEKHYKQKIEAIKIQYDINIKNILNEHNEGVKSIQGLHEETLQDIIKHHENEVEILRSMSIEAMRKADKLEKECRSLKCKFPVSSSTYLNEEPIKNSTSELRKHKMTRLDSKNLTKTDLEAFNVKPENRSNGPCTCSLDINVSDTIRYIFEQVDADQRKKAERTYLKQIANKILHDTVEALDCHELSFLHLKVCRIWKVKLAKEESLQKRKDSLEAEPMTKQWDAQKNTVLELDRRVAEEWRRLHKVREALCTNSPTVSKIDNSRAEADYAPTKTDTNLVCSCNATCNLDIGERRSAGDLARTANASSRTKKIRPESHKALGKMENEERREKKKKEEDKRLYTDEMPTRLRRSQVKSNRKL